MGVKPNFSNVDLTKVVYTKIRERSFLTSFPCRKMKTHQYKIPLGIDIKLVASTSICLNSPIPNVYLT